MLEPEGALDVEEALNAVYFSAHRLLEEVLDLAWPEPAKTQAIIELAGSVAGYVAGLDDAAAAGPDASPVGSFRDRARAWLDDPAQVEANPTEIEACAREALEEGERTRSEAEAIMARVRALR
jgi:hypothetical protein